MKKFIAIMLVALAAVSAFASGSSEQSATVATDGSTSMEKVILSLAEQYMIDNVSSRQSLPLMESQSS